MRPNFFIGYLKTGGGGGGGPPLDPQLQVTLCMLYIFSWQYVSFKINFSGTLRPSQGVWGTGEKGHLFQRNRGTKAKF